MARPVRVVSLALVKRQRLDVDLRLTGHKSNLRQCHDPAKSSAWLSLGMRGSSKPKARTLFQLPDSARTEVRLHDEKTGSPISSSRGIHISSPAARRRRAGDHDPPPQQPDANSQGAGAVPGKSVRRRARHPRGDRIEREAFTGGSVGRSSRQARRMREPHVTLKSGDDWKQSRTPLTIAGSRRGANAIPALVIQATVLGLLVAYYTNSSDGETAHKQVCRVQAYARPAAGGWASITPARSSRIIFSFCFFSAADLVAETS